MEQTSPDKLNPDKLNSDKPNSNSDNPNSNNDKPGSDKANNDKPVGEKTAGDKAVIEKPADPANVLVSTFAAKDWEPDADPSSPEWTGTTGVLASMGFFREAVGLTATEIRSRWTQKNLYLLFICPYNNLNLKPGPVTNAETNELWKWDVAEAFIGSDYLKTSRYKEFQVSPQGEYVDLDIDLEDPKSAKGVEWQSGFIVSARVDENRKVWYGEMKIPFASLDIKSPKAADELRLGLYRIEGSEPYRLHVAWRPTQATTFHVPSAFGSLVLK